MVNPFKKLKEIADEVQRTQDEVVDDLRDILPSGRGGNPPNLGGGDILGTSDRQLIDAEPLIRYSFPANVPDSIGTRFKKSAELRQNRRDTMATEDTIRDMVNDPQIMITPDMLDLINDPGIMMDQGMNLFRQNAARFIPLESEKKKKRKVSKYQKELGRQLKLLKKKHPRTRISQLMKRAHRATRKALK